MISSHPSKEMLVAAECSWLPGTEAGLRNQNRRLTKLLDGVDVPILMGLFRRHRISMLAQKVLEAHGELRILGESARQLAKENELHVASRLRSLQAEGAIRKLLSESNLPHQVMKGTTLSHRIYGNPLVRHTKDIDLLVQPGDLWAVVALLEREGWIEEHPCLPRSAPYRWLLRRRWYHLEFHKPGTGLHLEVHWHVEEIPGTKLDEIWVPRLLAAQAGHPIQPIEFLYLCAHGEHHSWMRLKWLGDIRALLERHPGLWDGACHLAPEVSLLPALRQVEALMNLLYDVHPGSPGPDADTGLLVEAALRSLDIEDPANGVPWEKGLQGRWKAFRFSWIGYRRFGWRDRVRSFLWREFFNGRDMLLLRLPGVLLPLLPVLRVVILALRPFSPALRRMRSEAYGH